MRGKDAHNSHAGKQPVKQVSAEEIKQYLAAKKAPILHPFTPIIVGFALLALVIVANRPLISLGVLSISALLALLIGRWRALLVAGGLVAPTAISLGLIYGLFGQWVVAGQLILRMAAILMVSALAISLVTADSLLRALTPSWPAPLLFVVGSVARMHALALNRWKTILLVQRSRGLDKRGRNLMKAVFALVVGLVTDAAARSRPLSRLGLHNVNRRTVMQPVEPAPVQICFSGVFLLIVLVFLGAVLGGWI